MLCLMNDHDIYFEVAYKGIKVIIVFQKYDLAIKTSFCNTPFFVDSFV